MGSDGLIELDESCWTTLAKYNLVLATLFGITTLFTKMATVPNPSTFLVVENGLLTLLFGGVQTYAWISR